MFALLLLPFRFVFFLLFAAIWLPLLILRAALKLVGAIVVIPFVLLFTLLAIVLGGLAFSLAFLVPLAPLFLLAFFVWVIVRLASPRYI